MQSALELCNRKEMSYRNSNSNNNNNKEKQYEIGTEAQKKLKPYGNTKRRNKIRKKELRTKCNALQPIAR